MSDPISAAQRKKKKKSPMDKLRSLLDDGSDIGLQSISGTVRLLLIHCEAAQREIDRLIAENDRWRHGADAVEALEKARAVMIRCGDALESDRGLKARREAFEMIQEQFEGVSHEDHEKAEALIPALRARAREGR